jgi:hypothetical protein
VRAINDALGGMASAGTCARIAMEAIGVDPTARDPIRTSFGG